MTKQLKKKSPSKILELMFLDEVFKKDNSPKSRKELLALWCSQIFTIISNMCDGRKLKKYFIDLIVKTYRRATYNKSFFSTHYVLLNIILEKPIISEFLKRIYQLTLFCNKFFKPLLLFLSSINYLLFH